MVRKKNKIINYGVFLNMVLIGLIIVLILSVFVFGGVYLLHLHAIENDVYIYSCGDGSFYNFCSFQRPYICKSGILYEKASVCKCPAGYKIVNDKCESALYDNSKEIALKYTLRFSKKTISFKVYDGVYNYLSRIPQAINSTSGKIATRADFELKKVNDEIQEQAILPLIVAIENLYPDSKEDQARVAISIVQNIPYDDRNINLSINLGNTKYPYQVLYDNNGSCEEKSELLVLILKELNYSTAIFYYPYENHEAVGIGCPIKNSLNNSGYCFVETTAPSIITDDKGYYVDGSTLKSNPIIIPISDGISLPSNLYDFYDAKNFIRLRNKEKLGFFGKDIGAYIKAKYGIK